MTATENEFLKIAGTGKSAGWRYALGLPIILGLGTVLGLIVVVLIYPAAAYPDKFPKNLFQEYIALGFSFLPFAVMTALCTKFLHGRKVSSLITPFPKIKWRVIGLAFIIWFLLNILQQVIGFLLRPGEYKLTFTPEVLMQLPVLVALTILQAGTEELVFRGYLLQGMSKFCKNTIVLASINGVLFGAAHLGNNEVATNVALGFFVYFSVGFFYTLTTIKSWGLEISLGSHIAQNVFAGSFVNYADGTLTTSSIFTIQHSDVLFELLSYWAIATMGFFMFKKLGMFNPEKTKLVSGVH